MSIAIVLLYSIVCGYAICNIPFFKKSNIPKPYLVSLFYIKIMAGIAYALLMKYQEQKSGLPTDTWKYFYYSIDDTNLLLSNPKKFFTDLFVNQYGNNGYHTFWASDGSFWADFRNWIYIKIIAIINVITNKNYVANLVVVNFLCFWGWVALYKILHSYLRLTMWASIILTFFIPSTLFWNSALHKDAFLFNSICLSIYLVFKSIDTRNIKPLLYLIFHITVIICFRFYSLIYLFTGLTAIYIMVYTKLSVKKMLGIGLVLFFVVIAISPLLPPGFSMPQIFLDKQSEFKKIEAASDFTPIAIETEPFAFIQQVPVALYNSICQPGINSIKQVSYVLPAIESLITLISFVLLIMGIFTKKISNRLQPFEKYFIVFTLFYCFINFIALGFININVGSIVRYKSILLPFVFSATYSILHKLFKS
jgi:hypothetical protein